MSAPDLRPRPGAPTYPHLDRLLDQFGAEAALSPDEMILLQGDEVASVYRVSSGVARCFVMSENGRRQILRFAWPGDFLGCLSTTRNRHSVEAADAVRVRSMSRRVLESAMARDAHLRAEVRRLTEQTLANGEAHLIRVVSLAADKRLLDFLREIAAHAPAEDGFHRLPLMRRDIADYLGFSIETTSRAFTALRRAGRLTLDGADRFRIEDEALRRGRSAA